MLTRTDRGRIAAAFLMSASVIGLASCHHHTHTPATANPDGPAVALAYPTGISIPDELAQAIGGARAHTAIGCPSTRATSWAEIDETGTVVGIEAACVAGP